MYLWGVQNTIWSVSSCNSPSPELEVWKWCRDFCRAQTSTKVFHNALHGWMKVHQTSFLLCYRNTAPVHFMQTGRNTQTSMLPVYSWFLSTLDLIFNSEFLCNPSNFPTLLISRTVGQSTPKCNYEDAQFNVTAALRTSVTGQCLEKIWKMIHDACVRRKHLSFFKLNKETWQLSLPPEAPLQYGSKLQFILLTLALNCQILTL